MIQEIRNNFHESIVDLLNNPDKLEKTLNKYFNTWSESRSGKPFSFYNFMMLQSQYDISYCCAFSVWNEKYNRKIKKGAKSLKILIPIRVKTKMLNEDDEVIFATRFKTVPVFDISQTEARDETSTLPYRKEKDKGNVNIKNLIKKIDKKFNIKVKFFNEIDIFGASYRGEKLIKVKSDLNDEQTFGVIMHELAHQLMHEKTKKETNHVEYEAESVAYILCSLNKIETESSKSYVADWCKNKEKLDKYARQSANTIISTVNTINTELFA